MMEKKEQLLQQGDAIDVFIKNIELFFPSVETFYFIVYSPSLSVEQRLDYRIPGNALLFGQKKWDFERMLIESFNKKGFDVAQVRKLLIHDFNEPSRLIEVEKGNVKTWLKNTRSSIDPTQAIGLVSKCLLASKEERHIPLMDFSCPPNDEFSHFVAAAVQETGQTKGIIVDSGKSFHYYGLELFSCDEWRQFMNHCLLLSPFTDIRYIGHRLLSGYGILRITGSSLKPAVPKVVQIIGEIS